MIDQGHPASLINQARSFFLRQTALSGPNSAVTAPVAKYYF